MMKTYFFDQNGLRFSPAYLDGIKSHVLTLTLEEQSEFVDKVTYQVIKNFERLSDIEFISDIQMEFARVGKLGGWNTTSVGNLAFVALHHPNEVQQSRAKEMIELIKKNNY